MITFPIAPINVAICGAAHPNAFICTRPWNHKGPHAAHMSPDDSVVEVWGVDVPEGASHPMSANSTVRVDWEMMDGMKGTWFFDDPRKGRDFTEQLEKSSDCSEFAFYPLSEGNRGKFPSA